jgi:hypothetical protein
MIDKPAVISPIISDDEKEAIIFTKILAVLGAGFFIFSLFFWLPVFVILPMIFDGGVKMNAVIFVLTFLAYPLWSLMMLWLLWKHQKPEIWFIISSGVFVLGVILSFLF